MRSTVKAAKVMLPCGNKAAYYFAKALMVTRLRERWYVLSMDPKTDAR